MSEPVRWLWPYFDRGETRGLLTDLTDRRLRETHWGGIDYGLILRQLGQWSTTYDRAEDARDAVLSTVAHLVETESYEQACRVCSSYVVERRFEPSLQFVAPGDLLALLDYVGPLQGMSSLGGPMDGLLAHTRSLLRLAASGRGFSPRAVVEQHAPHLVADGRFKVIEEDEGESGHVVYGNYLVTVSVDLGFRGSGVSIHRTKPTQWNLGSALVEDLYVHVEQARPPWTGQFEAALEYLDGHLDDIMQVAQTDDTWDGFLGGVQTFLDATLRMPRSEPDVDATKSGAWTPLLELGDEVYLGVVRGELSVGTHYRPTGRVGREVPTDLLPLLERPRDAVVEELRARERDSGLAPGSLIPLVPLANIPAAAIDTRLNYWVGLAVEWIVAEPAEIPGNRFLVSISRAPWASQRLRHRAQVLLADARAREALGEPDNDSERGGG